MSAAAILREGCSDGSFCHWVLDRTHNSALARLGGLLVGAPLRVALIVLSAWLVAKVARRLIKRAFRSVEAVQGRSTVPDGRSVQRTRTASVMVRSIVTGLIWTVAVLTVISELGINLGAFVVTTTVIGGAIAFGAQTLVRDFLSGIFMLTEDQFGVGDIVDLGLATGTVEKVTLRRTQLRDVEGRVWHIPNGQILRTANLSQQWATAVLDIPVTLASDPDQVTAVLLAVGADVVARPEHAERVLGPVEVTGVQELHTDRYVLRLTVRTRPAAQFAVTRALRAALVPAMHDGRIPQPAPPAPAPPA